ncbi:MAG TPA: N-methyl-L-tryptophan oxidase, partial [Chitinophagaceae bacterium]
MDTAYDVIVIGVGSMGSSACYFLSKAGLRVLGLEQYGIVHEQGSHTGQTRIIRKAYFEDPSYVPLLVRAYQLWAQLEQLSGEKLFYRTGLLYAGTPGHSLLAGVRESARAYAIDVASWDSTQLKQHFPQFHFPTGWEILFEADAGFVRPEATILAYTKFARALGASIHENEKVLDWTCTDSHVTVKTRQGIYHAAKLVITAGSWAGQLVPGLRQKISVSRQVLAWMQPAITARYEPARFPCWMLAMEDVPGCYYGFPYVDEESFGAPAGLKLAHHTPGNATNPERVDRHVLPSEVAPLREIITTYFHGDFSDGDAKTCLYANSPDENFMIDLLPGTESRVAIAAGFSGHGFKFVPVVGEILAGLIVEGSTDLPVGFLSLNRF